jgi:hypothetical protein
MSASLASGTYGRRPASFTGALRQLVGRLLGSPAPSRAGALRTRVGDADGVRRLARSVERHSPGLASDLYAAAARHDGLAD